MIRVDRKLCEVELTDGTVVSCALRGHLFEFEGTETKPMAVGDRVRLQMDGDRGVVEEVLPRQTELSRIAVRGNKVQVLAANVEQMVVVTTLRRPRSRPGMVDRLLAVSEHAGLSGLIVVNKVDLCGAEEVEEFLQPYAELGYSTARTSATESIGLEELRGALKDKVSVLVGHSGVGKSSLLNALSPELGLTVGSLMREGKGRHTTTFHALWKLPFGGRVVDGPGVREFSMAGMTPEMLWGCFPEIRALQNDCHFPNCSHTHEPDCVVKPALLAGEIRAERFLSYLKLLEELQGGGQRMPRNSSF